MAPDASIVLLTSPVDETEGVQGMPQFDAVENYALDHHLGQVISQSWGATENTLFTPAGDQVFRQFSATYGRAAAMGVTVLASTGDNGASNLEQNGTTFYSFPTVNFPASSPLVTAVGGTSRTPTPTATISPRLSGIPTAAPAAAASASSSASRCISGCCRGSDQTLLGGHRGVPDISWNADPNTTILIYLSFLGSQRRLLRHRRH